MSTQSHIDTTQSNEEGYTREVLMEMLDKMAKEAGPEDNFIVPREPVVYDAGYTQEMLEWVVAEADNSN